MRDHHPVAVQVGGGDFLDARERLGFDRSELREIDLRPGQQIEPGAGGRRRRLGVAAAAGLAKASTSCGRMRPRGPAAFHLPQIDAAFACALAHRRAGIRNIQAKSDGVGAGLAREAAAAGDGAAASSGGLAGVRSGRGRWPAPPRVRLTSVRMTLPSLTRSPTFTFSSCTSPLKRRGHVHRSLVGFQRHERLLRLNGVAGLHHDLDDRHVLEIADVGDADLGDPAGACVGAGGARNGRLTWLLCAAPAPSTSSVRIGVTGAHLVAYFHGKDLTTPAAGEGTSIEALSDSSVMSGASTERRARPASPGSR